MTIPTKLAAGLLSASLLAITALPAIAQQARVPRDVRVMQRGTMIGPGMLVGRPTLQDPGDRPFMGTLPQNAPAMRPGASARSPFGAAVVTRVQGGAVTFRSQSGFFGRMTLPLTAVQRLHLRTGSTMTLTQLRNGLLRIQTIRARPGCPGTSTSSGLCMQSIH